MKFSSSDKWLDQVQSTFRDEEVILLESQMEGHPSSKKTLAALKPKRWIRAESDQITIFNGTRTTSFRGDPWEALKVFRNTKNGWLFGYLGYDLKNFTEKLQSVNRAMYQFPDLYFMEPESLLIYENGEVSLYGNPVELENISPGKTESSKPDAVDVKELVTKEEYIKNVVLIKERIAAGDFYELNYSYALQTEWKTHPYRLFQKMRAVNPVPFGAYIQMEEGAVCSISPERFLRKEGGKIISEPIKGTSVRMENAEADKQSRQELLNEKNRAENLMIVDLVRHDLSKVAKTGSVQVEKLFDVQSFGTVHQLLSTVVAEAANNTDAVDIVKECFPMGSMTGAPKIEVMKAIDNLENYKRGIYSGAIGYFTPDDDFDFNVVIRSAIVQNHCLTYPVGGAITSDSDADAEWEETKIKAQSLTKVFRKDGELRNEAVSK
ncbi:MAG: anthranilate synthase component I family protein [Balneolaceae bacterium]|nr:MAG: anthranilate synthase component I family protein [Balneolaceae bacterium]